MNIKLKPIAESKVRQLGGDVCGVLVRKDEKLAAVDEHGRVMWLDSWGETDRSQDGQGAEPVALLRREIGESSWFDHAPVKPNTREADALKSSPILDYCEVYAQPQPAGPEGWRECLAEMAQAMHDYEMSVDEDAPYKHRAMMDRAHALLSTTTPQADGWVRCEDRLPTEDDGDFQGGVFFCAEGWKGSEYWHVEEIKAVAEDKPQLVATAHWMPTGLKRPDIPRC